MIKTHALASKLLAEALSTALLLATVIGSGIMGAKLAGGNIAIALLANAISTGAMLVVLILIFGPLSGAHMNPIVSLAFAIRRELAWGTAALYTVAQIMGAVLGVWLAHAMFELPILELSTTIRSGSGQWIAEAVATFGLLITIFGTLSAAPHAVPYAVGLYITSAYWFTASTSFANPAVTLARALSDTFAGIAPASVPLFLAAQGIGLSFALGAAILLWPAGSSSVSPDPKTT